MPDWVDKLSQHSFCELPMAEPVWWCHPLIYSIGLPKTYPPNIFDCDLRTKAYIFFLIFFDPPENLQGLQHQLLPLRFLIKEGLTKIDHLRQEPHLVLGQFIDDVQDYISSAPQGEKEVLKSNKLKDIQKLGVWRFHFHCSQVNRLHLDIALELPEDNISGFAIRINKIKYLQDGSLDPLYKVMAFDIHKLLHRRNRLKKLNTETTITDSSLIYNDVLASEHCLHLGHHIVDSIENYNELDLTKEFKARIKALSHAEKADLKRNEKVIVRKIISHIRLLSRLIATGGSVRKRTSRQKQAEYHRRLLTKRKRLLPPAQFEDIKELSNDEDGNVLINHAFNFLTGQVDDDFNETLMKRRLGVRPKFPIRTGESDDDYVKSRECLIPASWVADPYQNKLKQDVQIESVILNLDPPVWSSACLSVPTILDLHGSVGNQDAEVKLAIFLLLHVGLSYDKLSQIQFGVPHVFLKGKDIGQFNDAYYKAWIKELDKHQGIYIDSRTFQAFYLLPKETVAYYKSKNFSFTEQCKAAQNFVTIDFPPIVRSALKEWVASNFCSHDLRVNGTGKVFKYWKKLGDKISSYMQDLGVRNSENITLSRLKSTFRSLYIGQAGLSPIYANIIMQHIPSQYRAQHFYTNINVNKLWSEYHKASDMICASIGYNGKIEEQKRTGVGLKVGSRIVPEKDRLLSYFAPFFYTISFVRSTHDYANLWNLYIVYCYRLLQLLTGIRPERDGYPDWGDISFGLNWIRISDKDNVHFYESRIVPFVGVLKQSFEHLAGLQRKIFIRLNFRSKDLLPSFRNQPTKSIFVYCDVEQEEFVPLKKSHFERVESFSTPEHIPNLIRFNYKDNALRHYLSTTLIESGLDQHLIDFIMGHKHFGLEAFGKFSPVGIEKYQNEIGLALDKFVYNPIFVRGLPKLL